MLTYQDCLPLVELDEEEARMIASQPPPREDMMLELGNYILLGDDGLPAVRESVLDELKASRRAHDLRRSAELKLMLQKFVDNHPLRRATAEKH